VNEHDTGSDGPGLKIRPHDAPGLATCVEQGRLSRDGVCCAASPLDVEALCVAEWAFAQQRTVLLSPIDPLVPLPALIAAGVHIADFAEGHRRTGTALGSSRRVAIVTRDYRVRGAYRSLGVSRTRGRTPVPLRSIVPSATVTRGGEVHVLDSEAGRGWSTIFLSSLADMGRIGNVDLAVIDLPVEVDTLRLDGLPPAVLVARDPADPLVAALARRLPTFAWDVADLRKLPSGTTLPPRQQRRAAGVACEIVNVPHHGVCENAALFWQDIGPLVQIARHSPVGQDLAREAFALFHDLLGLALPLDAYETLAVPVRLRIDSVGRAARLTSGDLRDLYLPMVETELDGLAAAIGRIPAKREALLQLLTRVLRDTGDVMLAEYYFRRYRRSHKRRNRYSC